MSSSLSSLSAELRAQGAGAVSCPEKLPPRPPPQRHGPRASCQAYWMVGSMAAMRSATMRASLYVTSFKAGPELHARMTCGRHPGLLRDLGHRPALHQAAAAQA